jgi:hypothetical protein
LEPFLTTAATSTFPNLPACHLTEQTGDHHTPCRTLLSTTRNINQHSPWAEWSPYQQNWITNIKL